MPSIPYISCVIWGRKNSGKTTIRNNLDSLFGEQPEIEKKSAKSHTSIRNLLEKPKPKMKTRVTVTSRAWFGLTADTITSLANSYPITIDFKEMRNSWYSLESEYYLKQLRTATVIMYTIDSTARWELHEERPLFEKFLQLVYGDGVSKLRSDDRKFSSLYFNFVISLRLKITIN